LKLAGKGEKVGCVQQSTRRGKRKFSSKGKRKPVRPEYTLTIKKGGEGVGKGGAGKKGKDATGVETSIPPFQQKEVELGLKIGKRGGGVRGATGCQKNSVQLRCGGGYKARTKKVLSEGNHPDVKKERKDGRRGRENLGEK